MANATTNPTDTNPATAARNIGLELGRLIGTMITDQTGLRSDLDQLQALSNELTAVKNALEALQEIADNHNNRVGNLEDTLEAVRVAFTGVATPLMRQAENVSRGGRLDPNLFAQSQEGIQRIAQELRDAAAGMASRLERMETALEINPDTGRSAALEGLGWRVHHTETALGMDGDGNFQLTDHVNGIRDLLGLTRPDGQPDVITELTQGQREIASTVGQLNATVHGTRRGDGQFTPGLIQRVEALENQDDNAGTAWGIGAVMALITWLFFLAFIPTPGWAEVVIAIGTFLGVGGLLTSFKDSLPFLSRNRNGARRRTAPVQQGQPANDTQPATRVPATPVNQQGS